MYHLKMEVSDYYSTKDHFIVEDLFDFNNDEPGPDGPEDNGVFDAVNGGSSTDSSTVTGDGNGYSSSASGYGQHLPTTDFCQPCEEVAELEWLSNFVEDCFSSKDYQKLPPQFASINLNSSSSSSVAAAAIHGQQQTAASSVTAKARSKRSRANPSNWASRIPILSAVPMASGALDARNPRTEASDGGVRRCLHCGSDKTPQWRMGPMGPKTLCNACGVRYKSGRLVPEYRPAASPTFVVSEHSNSHRKVLELRRQKEQQKQQQHLMFWS